MTLLHDSTADEHVSFDHPGLIARVFLMVVRSAEGDGCCRSAHSSAAAASQFCGQTAASALQDGLLLAVAGTQGDGIADAREAPGVARATLNCDRRGEHSCHKSEDRKDSVGMHGGGPILKSLILTKTGMRLRRVETDGGVVFTGQIVPPPAPTVPIFIPAVASLAARISSPETLSR